MIFSPFERLLAFRYLRARRAEGFISVIATFSLVGIMLGVATLIVVLSVMRGVREEMIQSIIGLEGHVTVSSAAPGGIGDVDAMLSRLRGMPGVKSAIPVAQGQVMASFKGQAAGAQILGLRAEDFAHKPLLAESLSEGAIERFAAGEGIIIGSRMAERMGVQPGDSITLISSEGRATPAGTVPRIKAYPVVGVFRIGMFAYDNGLIVVPYDQAQVFFRLRDQGSGIGDQNTSLPTPDPRSLIPGRASAIEVNGMEADNALHLARALRDALGEQYRVYDWQTSNGHLLRAVMVQRNVFFMILTLIILVASFNIVSSLIMLVREKGRDIAILRTMGATRGMVLRIFLLAGASTGIIGTLAGVGLGLLISFNTESIQQWLESLTGQKLLADELYFLSSLPAQVDMGEVGAVVLMSLSLSLIAAWYPARRAAKLDPAEVLRYE